MKKWSFLVVVVFLLSFQKNEVSQSFPTPEDETVTDKEFLLEYFKETGNNLRAEVEGLSEEQLRFKPSPEKWSVAQCLEHIVLTEQMLFENSRQMFEAEGNPERRNEISVSDQDLITNMEDRSHKVKASAELQPTGRYTDAEDALSDLMDQREDILQLIRDTPEEEMRNHVTDTPLGAVDGYQTLIFIAGHTSRHTGQIEEIKADPGFPED